MLVCMTLASSLCRRPRPSSPLQQWFFSDSFEPVEKSTAEGGQTDRQAGIQCSNHRFQYPIVYEQIRSVEFGRAGTRASVLYSTDFPAYSDTGYSDTPLSVTFLTCPKWPVIYKNHVVTVTLAYSDTYLLSRGCHCKQGRL